MNGNQVLRLVMRMIFNRGADAAMRHAANRGKRPDEMTADEREQSKTTQQQMKSARQGLNIARRLMR